MSKFDISYVSSITFGSIDAIYTLSPSITIPTDPNTNYLANVVYTRTSTS